MSELLLFITECISAKIIQFTEKLFQGVKYKKYFPSKTMYMAIQVDSNKNNKKNQLIEKKITDGNFQKILKKTYKNSIELKDKFA